MDKPPDPRLAALTGEAIKLMVEGGATAEVVGHFAIHYPAVVAAKLEPLPPPQEIDLEALVRLTVATVLGNGLQGALPGPTASTLAQGDAPPLVRGVRGLSRVKKNVVVNGKKTSIKLRADLYEQFSGMTGETGDRILQTFANEAPEGHPNRSAWVEAQITHHLVLAELSPAAQGKH